MRFRPTALLAAALLVPVGAIAGCSDDSDEPASVASAPASTPAASTPAAAPPTTPDAAKTFTGEEIGPISKDLATEPKVPRPTGDTPANLVAKDIVVGKGPEAKLGDQITVRYVGVSFSNGKTFDASWRRSPNAFPFQLGASMVIPGWDQGIPGMRVGGRRELVIPPALGYGAQGSPPSILPNETLVFVVDLKKIGA